MQQTSPVRLLVGMEEASRLHHRLPHESAQSVKHDTYDASLYDGAYNVAFVTFSVPASKEGAHKGVDRDWRCQQPRPTQIIHPGCLEVTSAMPLRMLFDVV